MSLYCNNQQQSDMRYVILYIILDFSRTIRLLQINSHSLVQNNSNKKYIINILKFLHL